MAIEIVDLSSTNGDVSIRFSYVCERVKAPFSSGFSYDFPIKPPFSIWYPQLEKFVPKHPRIINPQHEVGLQKDMHRRDAPANQSLACVK